MRTVNGNPDVVVEDDAPLPRADELVSFSHTVSVTSAREVRVVSEQLVASLGPAADETPAPRPGDAEA
jgi:hypothetical protein